eukprot:TRINITY_DN3155_c1_g2_i1.p1 TRINITY_DN3155_c1_g2~~TRINITY_DN3155_c1_g2_i1.p1  ORF type:complete len:396 (+),score=96.99 TRINITY_DN3155_c1_g2_i1:72-1190(+)
MGVEEIQAQIAAIDEELSRTQKNKATMSHICLLKARRAKLTRDVDDKISGSKKGNSQYDGFGVQRSGSGRVGLIGFPSVGKSTILSKWTNTESEVNEREFTTLTAIPGKFNLKGANIQLIDLPGIIQGAANDNSGRGRRVIGVARTCDLILIVLDAQEPWTHRYIIEEELGNFGIRLNEDEPDIRIRKVGSGGVTISSIVPLTHLDDDLIKNICKEYKINNADILFKCDATAQQFIDVLCGNRVYIPCVYLLNKIDKITIEELNLWDRAEDVVPIASHQEWNFDEAHELIWERMNLIRVYTKPRGCDVDFDEPVILRKGKRTVRDFCMKIHKDLVTNFKYAKIWGTSVPFSPSKASLDHVLDDEDVIQVIAS